MANWLQWIPWGFTEIARIKYVYASTTMKTTQISTVFMFDLKELDQPGRRVSSRGRRRFSQLWHPRMPQELILEPVLLYESLPNCLLSISKWIWHSGLRTSIRDFIRLLYTRISCRYDHHCTDCYWWSFILHFVLISCFKHSDEDLQHFKRCFLKIIFFVIKISLSKIIHCFLLCCVFCWTVASITPRVERREKVC